MTKVQSSQTHRAATPSWAPFQYPTECRATTPERRQQQKALGSLHGPRALPSPKCDDWIQYQRSIPPPPIRRVGWKGRATFVQHYHDQTTPHLSKSLSWWICQPKKPVNPHLSAVDCACYLLTHLSQQQLLTHGLINFQLSATPNVTNIDEFWSISSNKYLVLNLRFKQFQHVPTSSNCSCHHGIRKRSS
jgi:hypothetical protein